MAIKGIKVTMLSDHVNGQSTCEKFEGIEIFHIDNLMWLPMVRRKKILKALEESKADVVLWCGKPLSSVALTRLGLTKRPLVWIVESGVHDLRCLLGLSWREISNKHHNRFLLNEILNTLFPRFLLRTAANSSTIKSIIVPSDYIKNWLLRVGVSPHKLVIIPSALDEYYLTFPSAPRTVNEVVSRSKEDFVIMYMGSPCTLRGSDIFVRSIRKILDRQNLNLKCFLLSRGSSGNDADHLQGEEKYLEKLIDRLGVKDNVQIVSGLLSREKLVEFVQMSDVIVLPFKLLQSETPLSVLEAMSLGKVVVTTRIRTLGEIVGKDRGVLIEASDSDQLEEAILQIVNGKIDSERIKANAREYVASMPTWTDVTERTISVLENAVL
jgi:glycosyltransferase involved in cell wall biosynthesis